MDGVGATYEKLRGRPFAQLRRRFAIISDLAPFGINYFGNSRTDQSEALSAGKPIGVIWREFFDDLGMPEICFHCTRVTFITWCHRQGIPENVIMKLVNHASTEIHRIYQRLNVVDVHAWRDRVTDPYLARMAC